MTKEQIDHHILMYQVYISMIITRQIDIERIVEDIKEQIEDDKIFYRKGKISKINMLESISTWEQIQMEIAKMGMIEAWKHFIYCIKRIS